MTDQLNKLREIMSGNAPKAAERPDPRDAVGQGWIRKSEEWLLSNKSLPKVAKWNRYKTEIISKRTLTPNNKDYFWEKEFELHPRGAKAALADYERNISNTLFTMDEQGKENYLRDIAREAPSQVLNNLLLKLGTVSKKTAEKTKERARLTAITEFQALGESLTNQILSGEFSSLNPEVSSFSHREDLLAFVRSGQSQLTVDGDGRLAIGTNDGVKPIWSMDISSDTWEEEALVFHDLSKPAMKIIEPLLTKSRAEAKMSEYKTTMALFDSVEKYPPEFRTNIIVDGATASQDPMVSTRQAIDKIMSSGIEKRVYPNLSDLTRSFFNHWTDIRDTTEKRMSDGTIF